MDFWAHYQFLNTRMFLSWQRQLPDKLIKIPKLQVKVGPGAEVKFQT